MSDHISVPNIATSVKIGGFTLNVYAYRRLTPAECKLALSQYMKHQNIKKLPASGTGKVFTLFGCNSEDGL